MNFLFFDTETTRLPRSYSDATRPDCPHLVELAAILTDDNNQELGSLNMIIKPEGFAIPEEASNLHGITQARAIAEGIPLLHALLLFERLTCRAGTLVAHNLQFDRLIVKGAYHRLGVPHPLSSLARHCTMRQAQSIKGGRLVDLQAYYQHFFSTEFDKVHSALADVEACRRLFFKMRGQRPDTPQEKANQAILDKQFEQRKVSPNPPWATPSKFPRCPHSICPAPADCGAAKACQAPSALPSTTSAS